VFCLDLRQGNPVRHLHGCQLSERPDQLEVGGVRARRVHGQREL